MSESLSIVLMFFVLGLGAAAPIGPVNVEIIRRNVHLGMLKGVVFGSGACLADVTYLILLLVGLIALINSPTVLYSLGLIGSIVIAIFGILIMGAKSEFKDKNVQAGSLPTQLMTGYLMTMLNPYTILFWVSVSAQVAAIDNHVKNAALLGGIGILAGTLSWVLTLNIIVHGSRKFITPFVMKIINYVSGAILLTVAAVGLHQALGGLMKNSF